LKINFIKHVFKEHLYVETDVLMFLLGPQRSLLYNNANLYRERSLFVHVYVFLPFNYIQFPIDLETY